ncbi:glycine zipper family protein [Phenylobacterium sp.]|uniref:glycine zipper family protein n=1 Tax=Phenylobacterium sp. TaxID=1871053 RepID=UPI00286A171E|nr:glycine zipper family protein [Phenylobacterium sp.]
MRSIRIALVATVALATAAPAFAQPQPTQQYQRDMRNYENDRADYADRREQYEQARASYDQRREAYDRERARYDARYGSGAYVRAYGAAPAWDDSYWNDRYRSVSWSSREDYDRQMRQYESDRRTYDRNNGPGAYERRYGPAPVWNATDYGRDTSYNNRPNNDPCRDRNNNRAVAGGLIGAIAGAALGSNVAARNARTEGAVLGALVGGGIGAAVGNASDNAKCDDTGYYYSYDQTIPYRESRYERGRRSGQYDYSYYNRQKCRLAPAPISGDEYRYVRVCPDREGRFRITG